MLIIRVKNVQKSVIIDKNYDRLVEKLPDGLKDRLTKLLNKIPIGSSINILNKEKPEDAILKSNGEKILLENHVQNIDKFIEEIKLLIWFLEPHWTSLGNLPKENNVFFCVDCDVSIPNGKKIPLKCSNPNCPSHKKFKMVFGKSYKKPKKIQKRGTHFF